MSGLFSSLNSTVMALGAHSRAIETTGKNLGNVNNASYARQRVMYGDRGTVVTPQGAESLGMEALGVEQMRDVLLDRQVMREAGLAASYNTEQRAYQRAQAALGQSVDRTRSAADSDVSGIATALDSFFNAFQSFASRPTDPGERQSLLQQSAVLTDRLRLTDQRLDQVQSDLDSQIGDDVTEINRLLDTIAELNGQIGRFEVNAPGSAVDLRDQRQARLEELAAKLPVEVADSSNGQVRVFSRDANGAAVVLLDLTQVQGTVAFSGTQLTAGNPATALALTSGSVHGALTARDGAIETLRNDLDLLARQLVTSVNDLYNPTGATGDFFVASGTSAGTIRVAPTVSASSLKASDGGAAGDNSIALAIGALRAQVFSTAGGDAIDGTFVGFYSHVVGKLGQALAGANARVEDQSSIEQLVRSQRDAVSGVSLDEEMADLMKYQRAFQASSRVFATVDELLDLVVNRLGR
ncbi:MAG: flagellar hook-associated protein FlgK [Verrucomicrobia bacterium]|nr:flagellar hook-associated protein FlgK [Verrucomicrobiota bacterium]